MKLVRFEPTFASWREAARPLLAARIPPESIVWDDGEGSGVLPGLLLTTSAASDAAIRMPRKFVEMAARVALHRDSDRWSLLYRVAWRMTPSLIDLVIDPDVGHLHELDREVRRDIHKMHAFVRFKQVDGRYVAWYRPDHRILPLAAPFFVDRFRTMDWSILTPDQSAHWSGELTFGPGVSRADAPSGDELETLWRTYYRSMFNPARTNLRKMRADMPSRFWNEMPETRDLPQLMSEASGRVGTMIELQRGAPTAAPFVPAGASIEILRRAARECEGCDLHQSAKQTVFGDGPPAARLVFVGEQPGDQEDIEGRPFVGPAGEVFDRALAESGIDRREVYVTNAVKHFAFIERGKHRIHRTPRTVEVAACRPWLDAEIAVIDPELIVCLGATAARALLGPSFRVTQQHGQFLKSRSGRNIMATIHPSAVLRADEAGRDRYYAMLVDDLRSAADRMKVSAS